MDELITEDNKPTLLRSLLLRHRHVNEHHGGGFNFGLKKKYSSYSSLTVSHFCFICNQILKSSINFGLVIFFCYLMYIFFSFIFFFYVGMVIIC